MQGRSQTVGGQRVAAQIVLPALAEEQRRHMDDHVLSGHGVVQARAGQQIRPDRSRAVGQGGAVGRGPHQATELRPGFHQGTGQVAAHKTGAAGDENADS